MIRKCKQSKHFRYIKLYLIYYQKSYSEVLSIIERIIYYDATNNIAIKVTRYM